MGLFDKLFGKKECDICGGEIGLLGNRKLEDGNMCKACAAKLSPFFSDRRESTVEEIKEQLAYREANQALVEALNPTKVISGDRMTLYVDEDKKQFVATRSRSWRDDNPDVISFDQVSGCEIDVDESRDEIKRKNAEGEEESFDPPRYEYYYDFYIVLHVNSPWFSVIRFQSNDESAKTRGSYAYREAMAKAEEIREYFTNLHALEREAATAANAPKRPMTCKACGATGMPDANGCCEYCGSPLDT